MVKAEWNKEKLHLNNSISEIERRTDQKLKENFEEYQSKYSVEVENFQHMNNSLNEKLKDLQNLYDMLMVEMKISQDQLHAKDSDIKKLQNQINDLQDQVGISVLHLI